MDLKKGLILSFFLLLLMTVVIAREYTQDYNNPLTRSIADAIYCIRNADCQLSNLIVQNLTVLGRINNVTTIIDLTINESQITDLRHQNYSLNFSDGTNLGVVYDNQFLLINTTDDNLSVNVGSNHLTLDWTGGAHTDDTNTDASTECDGTTTYLDGDGNCDTLDSLSDFINDNKYTSNNTALHAESVGINTTQQDYVLDVRGTTNLNGSLYANSAVDHNIILGEGSDIPRTNTIDAICIGSFTTCGNRSVAIGSSTNASFPNQVGIGGVVISDPTPQNLAIGINGYVMNKAGLAFGGGGPFGMEMLWTTAEIIINGTAPEISLLSIFTDVHIRDGQDFNATGNSYLKNTTFNGDLFIKTTATNITSNTTCVIIKGETSTLLVC